MVIFSGNLPGMFCFGVLVSFSFYNLSAANFLKSDFIDLFMPLFHAFYCFHAFCRSHAFSLFSCFFAVFMCVRSSRKLTGGGFKRNNVIIFYYDLLTSLSR